jgi:DNA adenine methylase
MRHQNSATLAAELPSEAVHPVSPPAPYIGGKRNLSRRLCALIDATPHDTYVEPFVGMGGVFLKRTRQPRAEVINDISADVTTLFRVLQRHYPQFVDVLKWQITSRAEFDRLRAAAPETLTDLERAARFDVSKLAPMLDELHQRLTGVVIERLPYADLIRRYDAPGTLFFLYPPYWGCEGDYGPGVFERADFERLADQLAGIAGRFILTINATDGAREVFGRFDVDKVDTTYSIGASATGTAKAVKEFIVRN